MYLTQSLHRALQQHPDRNVVQFGTRSRTFREFWDRIARLAGALKELGLRPGDRVAMLALNSDRYLEYQMAVPWAGGVLNQCNTRWSAAEIALSLADSGSTILLVDAPFCPMVDQCRHDAITLREVIYCGEGNPPSSMRSYEGLVAESEPVPDVGRRGQDLAGIFYTGGTTGSPKGVMLSHTNLVSSALAAAVDGFSSAGDVYLHAAPMFHLADFGFSILTWILGNLHSIVSSFSPDAVLDAIERDAVSTVLLVPTMIQMLVDHLPASRPRDLSTLRTIAYGASPISDALLDRAMTAFPGARFAQGYGMTELSPLAAVNVPPWPSTLSHQPSKRHATGRPATGVELRIVDADGIEVPRGAIGEIIVRGPNVMLGYWNNPEATAAAIREGWMHTGDAAYMDEDGFVYVVDRIKDMIITGGENVYSAEVECALAHHPAVGACAVIGIPSELWGEAVHAVVVPRPGALVSAEGLITHCKTRIAGYKCPRTVAFAESLPLSGAGKVLKSKLREPYWRGQRRGVA